MRVMTSSTSLLCVARQGDAPACADSTKPTGTTKTVSKTV